MRRPLRLLGNALVALAVLGAAVLFYEVALAPPSPDQPVSAAAAAPTDQAGASPASSVGLATPAPTPAAALGPTPVPRLPITRVVVTSVPLDAEVVPARLVTGQDGAVTWQIPAFKAGHADGTAGAGQSGNAVLLGHVTSVHSGDVFKDLDQVKVGDEVKIFSGPREFDYRVVEVHAVPRTDVSVLAPTTVASVSLITCTGIWNPLIWDYTERLVVRAELES